MKANLVALILTRGKETVVELIGIVVFPMIIAYDFFVGNWVEKHKELL